MVDITEQNFQHEQLEFLRRDGGTKTAPSKLFVMIRPDRPFDPAAHRYPDDHARRKGNTAMKAWFEYLAGKGFFSILGAWLSLLKSGHSIMVVCADPLAFDLKFVSPMADVLGYDFWDEFEQSRIPIDRRFDPPEEHARIIQGFENLRRELRSGKGQPRVPGWSTLGDIAAKPLREWHATPLAEYRANTLPPLSHEPRAKLGHGVSEVAAE